MLHHNELMNIDPPGLLLDSKNTDRSAGKTSSYTGRDKNAEHCLFFGTLGSSGLVVVAFLELIRLELGHKIKKMESDIQQ